MKNKNNIQMHGSIPYADLREMGIPLSSIVDFSATVNPFPLPQEIQQLFNSDGIFAYPDNECFEARKAIGEFYKLPMDWILISAGLTEIIYTMPLFCKNAVCFSPTYGDYSNAFTRYGYQIVLIPFPSSGKEFNLTIDFLRKNPFNLLYVCNPNNPTGHYLPSCFIEELCRLFGESIICIDESYQEMSENCNSVLALVESFQNLIVLKSLTKPFGIGGLRAGYAVSSGNVLKSIANRLLPWNVSSLSQRIIPSLFNNYEKFAVQWRMILKEADMMVELLHKKGLKVKKSCCPFFLVEVGDSEEIRCQLLTEFKIAVRSCTSFDMPEWIRIMPKILELNQKIIDILPKKILKNY